MCSLPFTTGAKPISLSGFSRRARTGSHRKNPIFAPCEAYHGVFYACTFGGFCAILQKTARLSHTVLLLQLIPARGWKHQLDQQSIIHFSLQLIPARGRKLQVKWLTCILYTKLQLIPARGRKLLLLRAFLTGSRLQLIPARGRKRPFYCPDTGSPVCCNLSPRGDGNFMEFLNC